jgi:hypothetical protein
VHLWFRQVLCHHAFLTRCCRHVVMLWAFWGLILLLLRNVGLYPNYKAHKTYMTTILSRRVEMELQAIICPQVSRSLQDWRDQLHRVQTECSRLFETVDTLLNVRELGTRHDREKLVHSPKLCRMFVLLSVNVTHSLLIFY